MPLSTEFKQGKADYQRGYAPTECPWTDPAKEAEWLNGWYRASESPTLH